MAVEIPLEVLIKQRLEEDTWWIEYVGPFTIFRVPANIREANRSLYEPRMVSIGPYYHHLRKDRLRAMEDQKWRLLRSFLCRNSEHRVEAYVKAVRSLEKDARQSYSEFISLGQDEFVQMLLLDGCFILELFFKWLNEDPDILFKEGWGPTTIFSDLLLFENQIPFFIIEKLYDIVVAGEVGSSRDAFLSLLAKFLMDEEPSHPSSVTWPERIHHLLDLHHRFLIVPSLCREEKHHDPTALPLWKQRLIHWITPRPDQRGVKRPPRQIPCATELYEAGVKFRKKQSPKNLFDVKFSQGTLEIPPLQIDSNKKALLTNLVALERHKTWGDQTVTSYVALMDSLINTKEDVALLQHAGVIHNMLSSHQEAAVFFNRLGDGTSFDTMNHHFAKLFRNVQLYYDSNWNRSWARLIHDYFNSPWAVISVIAGMILLGLSALQTFYTVYPYYRPRS
ncbi:hypothetical protein LUZ62_083405 [Rhynchospora pubera]|uniref:Uncharacterized protein n=1 Tax=Rhynchospora pubera TaxID=906938 RepID=A0AAV8C0I0_9POAL|nr:hypothetical protein LUZ62_083405 [Rhynchospora pubera]